MAQWLRLSTYVPDRPPTWTEVGLAVLVVVTHGLSLQFRSPWLPAVLAGFVLFSLAIGPVANSTVGRRVGDWFRTIGYRGRGTLIVLFAIGVAVGAQSPVVPTLLLADIGYGGLGACVLFTALHLIVARDVSGWSTDESGVD
ncbi:hypothetical protein halTADL_0440 [Halohasta litchfieldiae]|jgi:hypothetical protein|uniref:Uncharacterized protein n=1 Tax=Halohasta litchfieldiae TaxID=1073996 RepID=A0A1H6VVP9_9EURY|nr:hypothetical protein [Halohasta litchfieldiae]ATW87253.1 hypothetical protein halTADL_0440 [Halohasta litchfieldiae]SEJ08709.1 hypothetical protein SAMN05444271_12033 [Halohasta litchfieldiae]